jgi:Na+/melibiose symporter-like transporter
MLADVTDAETLATGRSNAGLYYAVLVGVQKLGYAIPVGLAYIVLDAIGFDARLGSANSQSAIDGLVLLFLVPPIVAALIAAWLAKGWTIDRTAQQRIIAELEGKNAT